ncbi:MAG TPA: DNA recombination protein RmuC [Candidatus Margulisiibacteriota bacterium]|nr:DNA recombination protein RmuC [Candidatus Margulisiibacteriota bacterium]
MNWLIIAIFAAGIIFVILQLIAISRQLNERLRETSQALQDTHRTVGDRLDSATRVFGDVQKSLGRLEETHKQIYEIGKDISSLQELLRAPKFRGEVGETLLGRLLEDILPKENFRLQHRFKNGNIVDAAVLIGENIIPIDAKFPLENFRKVQEVSSEEEKKSVYRVFIRDVKGRVDEVSSKYILPEEGTFTFALMYIPAEAVYYQISRDEELGVYAQSKKVIFVSPNTFYAYLQAILYGLKGMSVERNIQKVFTELEGIKLDFRRFQEDFEIVGKHLVDASKKFAESKGKLEAMNERLDKAASVKEK